LGVCQSLKIEREIYIARQNWRAFFCEYQKLKSKDEALFASLAYRIRESRNPDN